MRGSQVTRRVAKSGISHPPQKVGDLFGRLRTRVNLSAAITQRKAETVYILCSIPLDIPVDELVTWKQLIGDRRLSDALAECDARGWDALPLAAKKLCWLFPRLWDTGRPPSIGPGRTPQRLINI